LLPSAIVWPAAQHVHAFDGHDNLVVLVQGAVFHKYDTAVRF
jgi:hypothetical protein